MTRLHELLTRGDPARIAIRDHDGATYSYAELGTLSQDIADQLAAHGIRGGDRVLLIAENCATFLASVMALSRLDAWMVLANARLTAAEIDRLIEVADVRAALFTPEASPASAAHAARLGARQLARLRPGALLLSPLRPSEPDPVQPGPEQIAALIYTSGTVGEPKGVMLSHGNLLFTAEASSESRRITAADTTLVVLPGTHIFGLTSVILAGLSQGSGLVLMPRFDADAVLRAIEDGVSILPAVPQVFAALLRRLQDLGQSTPRHGLRYIYAGGAPLDPGLKRRAEQAFGLPLHNGYGQTEASPSIAATRIEQPRQDAAVGQPLRGTEICIHAPDAEGVGELWVRGPNVMKGYYRNPEATAQALTPEGYLRTGDLARLSPDGALHIAGRLKELIVRSGFNIYPPEIEGLLSLHPAVQACAVVGRPRDGDEEVIAFATLQAPATEAQLQDWLRPQLAPYKRPARIVIVPALPQAATGKILKKALLDSFRPLLETDCKEPG